MILDLITNILKEYTGKFELKVEIIFLLIGVILIFGIKNIVSTQYDWIGSKWRASTQTMLEYFIFTKLLKAQVLVGKKGSEKLEFENSMLKDEDNKSKKVKTKDDHEESPDVMNLMSVDIER